MNHLQFIQSESYVSPSERRWETWISAVEKLVGHTFPFNSTEESNAHDAFLACDTPEQYAAEFTANSNKRS